MVVVDEAAKRETTNYLFILLGEPAPLHESAPCPSCLSDIHRACSGTPFPCETRRLVDFF